MKFPKLKHTFICTALGFSPALLLLVAFGFAFYLDSKNVSDRIIAAMLIACFAVAIVLFIFTLRPAMQIETVKDYKRSRLWYYCPKNGNDPETIKSKILKRIARLGKQTDYLVREITPIQFNYRFQYTKEHNANATIESLIAFEVAHLSFDIYERVLNIADSNFSKLKNTVVSSININFRKVFYSKGIVILTDHVDDRVINSVNDGEHFADVCVVELSTRRCFVNTRKLFGVGLIVNAVFGGRIPRKGNDNYLPWPKHIEELAETSYWDLVFKKSGYNPLFGIKKRRALDRLKNGEIAVFDEIIYVKVGYQVASFITDEDEQESDVLTVYVEKEPMWYDKPDKTVCQKDLEYILERIERFSKSQGKKVKFVDPDDEDTFD